MTITDADASPYQISTDSLALQYASKLDSTIFHYKKALTIKSLLIGTGLILLATLGFILLFKVIRWIYINGGKKLTNFLSGITPKLQGWTIQLLPADRLITAIMGMWKLLRAISVLAAFYFYLSIVFSFFDSTQGLATKLLSYVIDPLKTSGRAAFGYLPNLFFVIVIIILTRIVIRFTRKVFDGLSDGSISFNGFYPEWALPTYKIFRFLIIAFAVIIVFPYLPGSNSPAFKGVSLFFGILFSLGSTSAIANMVAGTVLTYMRPFKIGDRVRISDAIGDVVEKTLLVTRIRTIKNVEITIPNAMVLGSHIINFSSVTQGASLILHTTVTIGYDVPWRKVHELLISAALATEGLMNEPKPFVLQTALNDFSVAYEINASTNQPNGMAKIYSELHKNIQDKFNEAGVEIMSPVYSAIRDGNQATIPEEYLPKSYEKPGFKIIKS